MSQETSLVTIKEIVRDTCVDELIETGNNMLGVLGYTEHSKVHATRVSTIAGKILKELGYSQREIELARMAGYMHDVGNAVNRTDHAHSGAILVFQILKDMNMEASEIASIVGAIGNHDEKTGTAFDPVSAALVLADKTDVRRNRVRNKDMSTFDIHDRVNYAVTNADLQIDVEKRVIHLDIQLDDSICSVLDYFEIFLERMIMCRRAAEILNTRFKLTANGSKVL